MQPPDKFGQPPRGEIATTVAALVQLLVDAGMQPHKIKGSLTKSAKPANLLDLEMCLEALPRANAQGRRGWSTAGR